MSVTAMTADDWTARPAAGAGVYDDAIVRLFVIATFLVR